MMGYILISIILSKILMIGDLSSVYILWSVNSIIAAIIAGRVFFDEKFDYEDIAVILVIIISLYVLQRHRQREVK